MKNLNENIVKNIPVPYLKPDEQLILLKGIEARFSLCDSLEKSIDSSLKNADLLRMSILKKAFAGELVGQDPADPASLVLSKENT